MLHLRKFEPRGSKQGEASCPRRTAKISPWAGSHAETRAPGSERNRSSAGNELNGEFSTWQSLYGNQAILRLANSGVTFSGQTGSGSGSGSAAPPAPAPKPNQPAPPAPANTIDRIDFIDSPQGALGGFQKVREGDLNVPGAFDSPQAISHPLQVHFHLDKGNSANLRPRREIQQTASASGRIVKRPPDKPAPRGGAPTPGGFEGATTEPDGPRSHEIQRPATDRIVVADAPGILITAGAQPYPIVIKDHFVLTIADTQGHDIAKTTYDVAIVKQNATDANRINVLLPDEKKDLVRGRDL
jgi:hypothetical protein